MATATRAELVNEKFHNFVVWVKQESGHGHDQLDLADGQTAERKFLFLRDCVAPRLKAFQQRKLSAIWEVGDLLRKWSGETWPEDFDRKIAENAAVREKFFRYLECFAVLVSKF